MLDNKLRSFVNSEGNEELRQINKEILSRKETFHCKNLMKQYQSTHLQSKYIVVNVTNLNTILKVKTF